jgi:hypothetical protein
MGKLLNDAERTASSPISLNLSEAITSVASLRGRTCYFAFLLVPIRSLSKAYLFISISPDRISRRIIINTMSYLAMPSRNSRVRTLTSKLAHSVFFYVLYRHVVLAMYRHMRARGVGGSLHEVSEYGKQVRGDMGDVSLSTNR